MAYFKFMTTQDGSIGLYNEEIMDIYHAREGAYSEALEKFAIPSIMFIKKAKLKGILNLCDICFGIGYNSFAFLENFLSDEISNIFLKINISVIEYDKELIILAPFIKNPNISFILRKKLLNSIRNIYSFGKILDVVNKYQTHIDKTLYMQFKGGIKYKRQLSPTLNRKRLFLHNTYYNYMSNRFKYVLRLSNIKKIKFNIYDDDARKTIKNINTGQNIVFLDAFDPKKLPTLWTKEFFEQIYKISDDNFELFTYSHAACVRSAMIEAKFFVGQNNNKGTIAVKNKKYISAPLSKYEEGLLNTSAGICFRDYNLNGTKDDIIQERLRRVKSEGRESSTHYAKTHQK